MKKGDCVRDRNGQLMAVERVSASGWVLCSWYVKEGQNVMLHCEHFRKYELKIEPAKK